MQVSAPKATVLPTSFSSRYGRSSKRALQLALVVSLVAHFWVSPWRSWLGMINTDDSEVKDKPLELPMELSFEEQNTAPPHQDPVEAPVAAVAEIKKPKPTHDAGAPQPARDAGPRFDAGARLAVASDAGLPPGAAGTAAPARGENEVDLIVNMALIRKHPDGLRAGALLMKLPVWKMMEGTGVDPVRDFDALRAYGSSIWMNRAKSLGIDVRYNAPDALIDAAATRFSSAHPSAVAWSFSSPTVRAYPAKILDSDVVMLRGKTHTLSIVKPPSQAAAFATYMETNARDVPVWTEQLAWVRIKDPSSQLRYTFEVAGFPFTIQFPPGTNVFEVKTTLTGEGGINVQMHVGGATAAGPRSFVDTLYDSALVGLYESQIGSKYKELPSDLLTRRKVTYSGNDVDVSIAITGSELQAMIQYGFDFCSRDNHCR